jgi:hypothetical protein
MTVLLDPAFDVRTHATALQTALEIGAVSVDDVVEWARNVILETEHPHWSFCELALCSDKYPPDLTEFLSAVPGSANPAAARALVVRILSSSLWTHPERADQIARSLYDLAMSGELDDSPLREVAWWASDALDLAGTGAISETRADVIAQMHTAFQKAVAT